MTIIRVIRKYKEILSEKDKKKIPYIVVLMVIGGFLETLSVGLIIPFMDAVVNIDTIMDKWYVKIVCNILGLNYSYTFLFVVAASLGILYILKSIFLLYEYNVQYTFVNNGMLNTQNVLLNKLVSRPYEDFLTVQSADIIRLVNEDVRITYSLLETLLLFFSELLVSSLIIISIFIISPKVTSVVAIVLLILLLFIYFFIKPVMREIGIQNSNSYTKMNRWLIQSIQGIKETKVMNVEGFFVDNFLENGKTFINANRKYSILSMTPRFLIEAVCMSSLFFVIAFMIISGSRFNAIMPTLSTVAMAAIRLFPSVNRISSALSNVSYGENRLDSVIKSLNTKEKVEGKNNQKCSEIKPSGLSNTNICVENISYHYPGASVEVLSHAGMNIEYGESVGIVGNSGAGKTTLADIILGLLMPQTGRITYGTEDIHKNITDWYKHIGYIPQAIFMLDGSIKDNVLYGRTKDSHEGTDGMVWKALEEASLAEFVKTLPDGINTQVGERGIRLSGGQRQRIGIARALYSEPEILVMDEATSALDNETEQSIIESINKLHGKKTIIIIAHRLTTIEKCDHVYRVDNQKIQYVR